MVSLTDVLLAMSNIPVDDPIAEIWGRGLQGGYEIIEYTGTLPAVLTGTKAGYLESYKIYGNTVQNGTPTPENPVDVVGCGVRTENLFDPEHHITIGNVDYIGDVHPANKYRINNMSNFPCYYKIGESGTTGTVYPPSNIYINAKDIVYVWCSVNSNKKISLTEGTAPKEYEPYGYKLPMTVSDGNTAQTVPVYIGENQLDAGEYASYSDGKIYRIIDGTLTPTDPPVPLPEILTVAGTTTIDYDGAPKPSQMYVKYKGQHKEE